MTGDKVDAGVRQVVVVRPVTPLVDLVVLLRQGRVELEVVDHELLEGQPVIAVGGVLAQRRQGIHDRRHGRYCA